jgi:hypothetical protein
MSEATRLEILHTKKWNLLQWILPHWFHMFAALSFFLFNSIPGEGFSIILVRSMSSHFKWFCFVYSIENWKQTKKFFNYTFPAPLKAPLEKFKKILFLANISIDVKRKRKGLRKASRKGFLINPILTSFCWNCNEVFRGIFIGCFHCGKKG